MPSNVLTDYDPNFTTKYFLEIWEKLLVKPLTTTDYKFQGVGQVDCFKANIVSLLDHYAAELQQLWDSYLSPLTFAWNAQVRRATILLSSILVASRYLSGLANPPTIVMRPYVRYNDAAMALRIRLISWAGNLKQMLTIYLRQLQSQY